MRILSKNLCILKNGKIAFLEKPESARKNKPLKNRMQKIELMKVTEVDGEEKQEYLCFKDMDDEPITKKDIEYAIKFLSTPIEPEKQH
jgi:HJR/Mrr/RecB family endonuclease